MKDFKQLSKQEKQQLIQKLNEGSMRQTAILYGGILLVVIIAIFASNSLA